MYFSSVHKYLKDKNITQRSLAVRCSVGESHLSRVLGGSRLGSLTLLRRMSKETGIPLETLAKEAKPDGRAH